MKKLIATVTLGISMLIATSPAFAYTAKSGDTMGSIAKANGMTLQELSKANPQISNLDLIYVGQNINTTKATTTTSTTTGYKQVTPASSSDKDLLARLVEAEAGGEPYAGKVAVAVVVLNRVDSADFPNSIHDVIYQSGQFSPVSNGQINNTPSADSVRAVNEALSENRSLGAGSLFFYNPSTAVSRWLDSRPTTIVIGHHVFKK
ncbi:cell wall hydrolase [Priestia aryabhattai]|uniref:cell wall hydrolase n=1 Tax=Priestia aryabhattai TaxID=412384 RepID=UPI002E20AE05|nr:cell wall hydrolase [Priestia aryabhattai]MED4261986.1 cell wall hydrolase [Priestia aryabhattai]